MNYLKHETALVESKNIGDGSSILAYTHVMGEAKIGYNCDIADYVFIDNGVNIGNNVTIQYGAKIVNGITIEDNVFLGSDITFSNQSYPRSKKNSCDLLKTVVCEGASICSGATILPGITIGRDALIEAGSVVTKDVPPKAVVKGNPAYISGYVDSKTFNDVGIKATAHNNTDCTIQDCSVPGVRIHNLPVITDIRGSLSFAECGQFLPFEVKRYFIVYDVPNKEVRGEHAHKKLHQFLVCIKGSCSVMVDDGCCREEILLNNPAIGMHIPPMIWGVQYKYSREAALLVFASDKYLESDYIRNYDDFLSRVRAK